MNSSLYGLEDIRGDNPSYSSGDSSEDGKRYEKELYGYLQDDVITLYGVVSDYSYNDTYEQITTELILKDVHILLQSDKLSHNTSDKNSEILLNKSSLINTTISKNTQSHDNFAEGSVLLEEQAGEWKKVTVAGQSILIYLNKEETLSIGNTVLLSGKLSLFEPATNPGQFDAEKYYGNRDVLFAVKKASILRKTDNQLFLRQWLKDFGIKQEAKLEEYLSFSNATIMKAMLFGDKEELDEEIKELYQDNGIAHVLAISGLHISLLGMSVYKLLRRLPIPRWLSLFLSESFLILYGCMVGFSTSAFRAIVMFTFFLGSKIVKRSYDMITALAFTAILQLMIHPGYLFDCSFQLSYAAILGIGILLPALERLNESIEDVQLLKKFSFLNLMRWLSKRAGVLLPSLAVTLTTAPILIYHYHEISFFSIALNVIVIPFMSALLLSGIAMLVFANFFVPLAKLFAIPVTLILGFYEYSCRFLELFPIGQKNVASPSCVVLFVYYILLILMTVLVNKKRHLYQFFLVGVATLLLFFPQYPQFMLWITDVGQGDCSVIFTKEGNCFVIDCGSTSKYRVGERILIPFLKYYGVDNIDAVFVTHADADHMNGVLELMELGKEENIDVDKIVLYEKSLESEPEEWEEMIALADENEIPIVGMKQGDSFQTDSVTITCLYPLKEQEGLTGNGASLVLSLTARIEDGLWSEKTENGTFRALFTGDLEMEGEQIFMQEYGDEAAQGFMQEYGDEAAQGFMQEYGNEVAQGFMQEYGNEVAQGFMQEYGNEAAQGFMQEYGNEATQGFMQEYGDEVAQGFMQEYGNEATQASMQEYGDEAAQGFMQEHGNEVAQGFMQEYGNEVAQASMQVAGNEGVSAYFGADYDLLKVGHHGSSGSSSSVFLEWVSPKYALISCGQDNRYGHPHEETLERLEDVEANILSTSECGAIMVEMSEGEITISPYNGKSN